MKTAKNTTKRKLVIDIANETKIIQQDVYAVIQALLDQIMDSLVHGHNVELRNFGVFEVKERKPRIGRNPNKPEQVVTIPSRKIVKFKPGKIMKLAITEGKSVRFLPREGEGDAPGAGTPPAF